jgi:hypothetical protein
LYASKAEGFSNIKQTMEKKYLPHKKIPNTGGFIGPIISDPFFQKLQKFVIDNKNILQIRKYEIGVLFFQNLIRCSHTALYWEINMLTNYLF